MVQNRSRTRSRTQQPGSALHYISVTKRGHDIPAPKKRNVLREVIDLCDSDDESSEEESSAASTSGPSTPGSSSLSSGPDVSEAASTSSTFMGPVSALKTSRAHGQSARPRSTLEGLLQADAESKKMRLKASLKSVQKASTARVAPLITPAACRSTGQNKSATSKSSSPPDTPAATATTTDPSSSLAGSSTTTVSSQLPVAETKTASSNPASGQFHRYRGPRLAVLSTQAIWGHLDQAWHEGSCTVKTITHISGWWAPSVVASFHKLDKHQIWLLLFAVYQWWQALEEQWAAFDALPAQSQPMVMRMNGVRLRKESQAVNAEVALATEGLVKDHKAVYVLEGEVKKEKTDEKAVDKKDKGENKKRVRPEAHKARVGSRKEGKAGQAKQVRVQTKKSIKTAAGVGDADEQETDDGLSSDSDEEEA